MEEGHIVPLHPLPEEIQRMKRDETVCKYCGVSYLIHNEIKNLEDKLKAVEEELTRLRGCDQREEALREELRSTQASLTLCTTDLTSSQHRVEVLTKDGLQKDQLLADRLARVKTLEGEVTSLTASVNIYKEKRRRIEEQLKQVQEKVSGQRQSLQSLKQDLLVSTNDMQTDRQKISQLMEQIQHSSNKCVEETGVWRQKCESLEVKVTEKSSDLKQLTELKTELTSLTQEVTRLKKTIQDKDDQIHKLDAKNSQLSSLQETVKKQCGTIERLEAEVSSSQQTSQRHTAQFQKEMKDKENELSAVRDQLAQLERQLQSDEKLIQDMMSRADNSHSHAEETQQELERVKGDLQAMKAEREMMITAHQGQIQQLRESFKRRQTEADKWPLKLEETLANEKKKHEAQLEALEANLKENFILELQIEKEKHQELLDKHNRALREAESRLRDQQGVDETRHKAEITELHRQLAACKARNRESENTLRKEVEGLKGTLRELEGKLGCMDSASDKKVTDLKCQLLSAQTQLADAKEKCKQLEKHLSTAKEEVGFLQETVHRECEERYELTEALSQAREELLSLKKPLGGYAASPLVRMPQSDAAPKPPQPNNHESSLFKRVNSATPVSAPQPIPTSAPQVGPTSARQSGPTSARQNSHRTQSALETSVERVPTTSVALDTDRVKSAGKGLKGNTLTESRKRIAQAVARR